MYPKSVADIFEALTPEARTFVLKEIKGTNKEGKNKLIKAIEQHKIETKSFADADIDLLTFDWSSIDMDRNWWWQMQALPFLGWFAQSYQLFEADEQNEMVGYCLKAFSLWLAQEPNSQNSPLRWHDHATAFRLTNIVNWLVAVASNSALIQRVFDEEPAINFAQIINQHVVWLTEDKNYSKHTNHGFDQAQAVYSLGLYVSSAYWEDELKIAKNRLIGEVKFAFTDEGVHKENSPGYHVFMMRRLEKLVQLAQVGDEYVGVEAKKIQDGAKQFLKAVTLPNGLLPMVGDTRDGQGGINSEVPEGPVTYDFSKSGYVIIKGRFRNKAYYLLIKNCHYSNYHRHDDDLSVYFWYDGKEILGDPGLGSHNESDKRRVFLRSSSAHNVFGPEGGRARRDNNKLLGPPEIYFESDWVVCLVSYTFDLKMTRRIDLEGLVYGELKFEDSVEEYSGRLAHNFISKFKVERDSTGLTISNDGVVLATVVCLESNDWQVLGGLPYSSSYGVFDKCNVGTLVGNKGLKSFVVKLYDDALDSVFQEDPDEKFIQAPLYVLKYRDFHNFQLFLPLDWSVDPYGSRNWVHNFLSLRWLYGAPSSVQKAVLDDFSCQFFIDAGVRSYLSSKKFDHTVAIRLKVLVDFKGEYGPDLDGVILDLLYSHVEIMMSEEFYRYGFNHGLLIDEALLYCQQKTKILSDSDLKNLLSRVGRQLDLLYDDEGITREHSVSYQEYNLQVLSDIKRVLCKLNRFDLLEYASILKRIDFIIESSKEFLVLAHVGGNRYLNIGDSFRVSNKTILKNVYGVGNVSELSGGEIEENVFRVYEKAGFGFGRIRSPAVGEVVYSIVSGNNSRCHKSNDELSICVNVNGKFVLFDGGYTDRYDKLQKQLKLRGSHTTVGILSPCEVEVQEERSLFAPEQSWVRYVTIKEGVVGAVAKVEFSDVVLYRVVFWLESVGLMILDWGSGSSSLVHAFNVEKADLSEENRVDIGDFYLLSSPGMAVAKRPIEIVGDDRSNIDAVEQVQFNGIASSISWFALVHKSRDLSGLEISAEGFVISMVSCDIEINMDVAALEF